MEDGVVNFSNWIEDWEKQSLNSAFQLKTLHLYFEWIIVSCKKAKRNRQIARTNIYMAAIYWLGCVISDVGKYLSESYWN